MIKKILTGISVSIITLGLGMGFAFADGNKVVEVNTQTLNVRLDANLDSSIVYKAGLGQKFSFVSQDEEWIEIRLDNGRCGWIHSDYANIKEELKTGVINSDDVSVSEGESLIAPCTGNLSKGDKVQIVEAGDEWTRIRLANGAEGFVYSSVVSIDQKSSAVSRGGARDSNMLRIATSKIGSKYSKGAEGPNTFDCSGYVKYIYKEAYGKELPHNSRSQYSIGTPVSKGELAVGDIVFFATAGSSRINHSGIYIGDGKFIHASSYDGKVLIHPLDTGHYSNVYRGAKRVLD